MISMDKKYKTRDGRGVRLLCTDSTHTTYPIVGMIGTIMHMWTKDQSSYDLIEDKPKIKVERWINICTYGDNPRPISSTHHALDDTLETHHQLKHTPKITYLAVAVPFVWGEGNV